MHKVTFFNLGCADCCRIVLENGKRILFDYANMRNSENQYDLRCDLPKELRDELDDADRDHFDVVAFTHLDEDHYKGASDFFWLEYAKKYQGDGRIKIDTLWVPAVDYLRNFFMSEATYWTVNSPPISLAQSL